MMGKYSIYAIRNTLNDKRYIGLTMRAPKQRKKEHFTTLKQGKHHSVMLQRAYDKQGRKSFAFEVLERGLSRKSANAREIYWIAHFDSFHNGYNMTEGGEHEYTIPHNATPCTWNNIEYPSIAAAARANGVTQSGMLMRFKRGYTCDNDMVGTGQNPVFKPVTWNGIEYDSVGACAEALGLAIPTISTRLSKGFTCDEDMPGRGTTMPHAVKIEWNGIEYPSIAEAIRCLDISHSTMLYRIRKGYSSDADMLGVGSYQVMSKACVWNGIEYETITDAAKANGINRRAMARRIAKGYTCDSDLNYNAKVMGA